MNLYEVHAQCDKRSSLLHFEASDSNPKNGREWMLRHFPKLERNKPKLRFPDSVLHIDMRYRTRKRNRKPDFLLRLPGIILHPDRSRSTSNPDVCPVKSINI